MLSFLIWLLVTQVLHLISHNTYDLCTFLHAFLHFKIKFTFFLRYLWTPGAPDKTALSFSLFPLTIDRSQKKAQGFACLWPYFPLHPHPPYNSQSLTTSICQKTIRNNFITPLCAHIHCHKQPRMPKLSLIPCTLTFFLTLCLTPLQMMKPLHCSLCSSCTVSSKILKPSAFSLKVPFSFLL